MSLAALAALLAAASQDSPSSSPLIRAQDLDARIATLASDDFGGRGPASPGEEKTIAYLVREMARAGLEPGFRSTWFQEVPLVAITPTGKPSASVGRGDAQRELVFGRDVMIVSPTPSGAVEVEGSELVFVGYGIVAPEYGWDDYAGIDVTGKTVVCLVNDPGYATQDPALFRGNAMTYYGRYTYKFEEAARQGAAACLVVHEQGAAGYPWQVVVRSWGGTSFRVDEDSAAPALTIEGWITDAAASELLTEAGQDATALFEGAKSKGARPVPLATTATFGLENAAERSRSKNVIGMIPGRERPDEVVLYCAHWDHLGIRPGVGEDTIYNGALDNASGTAGLLEIAEAFGAMNPPPERTVVFVAVTAEESGLLGSRYYTEHPGFPLANTVAGINMDGLNLIGPMEDIVVIGHGASELEEYLTQFAAAQGRTISPEATPEKGYFYRSDHFNFAKRGVPMLYTDKGTVSREHGRDWVAEREAEYLAQDYHQPSDEYESGWNLDGAIEDLRLFYAIGCRLANESSFPNWYEGNEFRAARDASRAK